MNARIIGGDQRLTTAPLTTPCNDTATSIKMSRRLNVTILLAMHCQAAPPRAPMSACRPTGKKWATTIRLRATPYRAPQSSASTGVTVDFALYRNRHALGLLYYLSPETGFETAYHGGDFATQCRRETLLEYLLGDVEGQDVFALEPKCARLKFRSTRNLIRQRRSRFKSASSAPRRIIPSYLKRPVSSFASWSRFAAL